MTMEKMYEAGLKEYIEEIQKQVQKELPKIRLVRKLQEDLEALRISKT